MTAQHSQWSGETDALLARLGTADGPIPLEALVAERGEPPDPELTGQPVSVSLCADVYLPLDSGPTLARVYRDTPKQSTPLVLWLHGGGFVGGSLADVDVTCRALATACPITVVSLDYRLAPEHPFPAALHDTDGALSWLADNGLLIGGDGRVVVGGQSAGANLALAASLDRRGRRPNADLLVLAYPWLDDLATSDSWNCYDGVLADQATHAWERDLYLAGQPVTDLAFPLRAESLAELPPALVISAGRDPYRDDSRTLVRCIREEGGAAALVEYRDVPHAFLQFPGVLRSAHHAIETIASHLKQALQLDDEPA